MIKLKELLELNEMTYNDGPTEKHQDRIDRPITIFEDLEFAPIVYPDNSSRDTLEEVKYLASLEEDREFVKKHDKVGDVFSELHEELGLEFDLDELKLHLRESSKYIMELKYKYNRPRPHQIAEFYGIDLNGVEMDSMKTPSIPSGHATQGYLLGLFYSKRYPEYRKEFMNLAEDIAESRLNAKAHFPSDKKAGIDLAKKLFDNLK